MDGMVWPNFEKELLETAKLVKTSSSVCSGKDVGRDFASISLAEIEQSVHNDPHHLNEILIGVARGEE